MLSRVESRARLLAAVLLSLGAVRAPAQTDSYTGPNLGFWSNAGNWSLGITPSTQNFDITINPPTALIVVLDTSASINSLSLSAGNALVLNAGTLGITGTSIANAALVQLNTGTKIAIGADMSMSGGGSVTLAAATSLAGNFRITSDNRISGQGTISSLFTNSGSVTASAGTLSLATPIAIADAFVNNGTLRANGGVLALNKFADYTNTLGTIEAINDSSVIVRGNISGGIIRGLSGGSATLDGPTLSGVALSGNILLNTATTAYPTLQNCTNNTTLTQQIAFLQVSGYLNNLGSIAVGSAGNFTFTSSGSLTGGGTILLTNSAIGGISGLANSLTSDNVIDATAGSSFISMPSFASSGTVHVTAATLTISGTTSLAGTVSVENDGVLIINSSPQLNVTTPITLNSGSIFLQATAQSTGTITGAGTITTSGGSISDSIQTTRLSISGTHAIRANQSTPTIVSTLSVAGTNSAWSGQLNLNNNTLILQTAGGAAKISALATLANQINSGLNAGNWQGNGITSATVAADSGHRAVGLFDNAFLKLTTLGGSGVNANSLLVMPALLGDANDDGHVNAADLAVVYSNWHKRVTDWAEGDLNLDGCVDSLDVQLLLSHWDAGVPFPPLFNYSPKFGYALNAAVNTLAVPEPEALWMVAAGSLMLGRRRRGSQKSK